MIIKNTYKLLYHDLENTHIRIIELRKKIQKIYIHRKCFTYSILTPS
jgi:hypothetical protein